MRNSNLVGMTGMLLAIMVVVSLMVGSAAATGDQTTAEITVVDGDGDPIDGAFVTVYESGTDDELGSGISDTAGDVTVTWEASEDTQIDVEVDHDLYDDYLAEGALTITAGDTETIDATLQTDVDLAVMTSDVDTGDRVEDVQFRVIDDDDTEVHQEVSETNRMTMEDLDAGDYTVVADRPDYEHKTVEVTVTGDSPASESIDMRSMTTTTEAIDDGDLVDEVYAYHDLSDFDDGDNVSVHSEFTLVIEDEDGNVTEYMSLGSASESFDVGSEEGTHTLYQDVQSQHDGAVEVVAATNTQLSDAPIDNAGYIAQTSGAAGATDDINTVWIGAGIVAVVMSGAALVARQDSTDY